jgi:xanthine dehydrogenase accessory factor
MNENEYLAAIVDEQLAAGSPLVLISIISLQGSTPRHDGTKMVVGADGKSYGTIGGSLIEAAAIKEAKKVLAAGKSGLFSYDLTGKDAADPSMICGGTAELLLDYLAPSDEHKNFARQWRDAIQQGKDFYIITHLKNRGANTEVTSHAILYADYTTPTKTSLTEADIAKLRTELHNVSKSAVLSFGDVLIMVDRVRKLKTVYCFGAGHVAVPTARLAALVGFRVVVLDDRQEYANAERFPEAHEIRVVKDFDRALDGLDIDADSYIVIITRGHQYDRQVLEQSLKTKAGYIGMISSQRKRQTIYEALMTEGVTKERLDWVHSPIGLDIGGETPEEIAVSVVAELISVRSQPAA